ncbi:hypothetical protein CHS0354_022681 [Potamilus streckersoni]|uniref:Uncharacterized protein n=1 Tax=Potamilus streckersoni TaxID=2493646 RepID=A0AAE0S7G9_9BIVA|nr:hypothetical protein CHS0354_022681 [Potamilus streckersoni]
MHLLQVSTITFWQIFLLIAFIQAGNSVDAQTAICKFYNLDADCRYRIDGISLSYIVVRINECNDPIDVTFHITNEKPPLDWRYTFSKSKEIVQVPGFYENVQLEVKQRLIEDDLIVEADFHVDGLAKADFIQDKVKMRGNEDSCPINNAVLTAIGVMCGLLAISLALLVVVLILRRQRKIKQQSLPDLISNAEPISNTDPSQLGASDGQVEADSINLTSGTVRFSDVQKIESNSNAITD